LDLLVKRLAFQADDEGSIPFTRSTSGYAHAQEQKLWKEEMDRRDDAPPSAGRLSRAQGRRLNK
jgi:hypothetical protein